MKALTLTLATLFATTAGAADLGPKPFSCITSEGNLVKYQPQYGELTEMTPEGKLIVDHDDGYDEDYVFNIRNNKFVVLKVFHHEEPETTVIQLKIKEGSSGPYQAQYRNAQDKMIPAQCI